MTAFSKNQLPDTINTVEKLAVWCGAVLFKINRTSTAVEGTGSPNRVVQFGTFTIDANNTERVIMRHSLLLADGYNNDKNPIWENVQELATDPISSEFLPS